MELLHPLIVHFPIALLVMYIVSETLSLFILKDKLKFTAQVLLIAGILSSVGAVLTGNMSKQEFENKVELSSRTDINAALENHEDAATAMLWYFTFLAVARFSFIFKNKFDGYRRIIIVILALAGFYLVYSAGNFGGELVFKFGIGTEIFK